MNFLSKKTITILSTIVLTVVVFIVVKNYGQVEQEARLECDGGKCNVILIVSDTLSAQHMSIYGYKHKTTPFMDDFFRNKGIVYENAYSNATWTLPSFASMFRSKYPSQIKLSEIAQKPGDTTLVELLRKKDVNIVGKVGDIGGDISQSVANVFGSEEFLKTTGDGEVNYRVFSEWINGQKNKEKPFFAFFHELNVHDPYEAPERYSEMFDGKKTDEPVGVEEIIRVMKNQKFDSVEQKRRFVAKYDQEVKYQDDMLKDFVNSIDDETMKKTIFIFTADHGEGFFEHGALSHNSGVYNEIVKVPLLIHLPQNVSGQKRTVPVSLIDIAPTILSIFGVKIPNDYEGINLEIDNRNTESGLGRIVVSEHGNSMWRDAFDKESDRLIENYSNSLEESLLTLVTRESFVLGNKKFVRQNRDLEMFNIKVDPEEKRNLLQNFSKNDRKNIYLFLKNLQRLN